MQYEAGTKDVDVLLVPTDVRIVLSHGGRPAVPPWHADGDAVALGGNGDMLALALPRQIERETKCTVRPKSRKDGLLHYHFAFRAFVHHTTD
ncbi:hypothetical protein D3C72_1826570 [compost metagenome]